MVTYGDMMSLLLAFFVMLVALSEIKKEDQFRAIVEKIREAFGGPGGGGQIPARADSTVNLIPLIETKGRQHKKERRRSEARVPGIVGPQTVVTDVRPGERLVVGGRIWFEPGSSRLRDDLKRGLMKVAEQLIGRKTKIDLRGHASSREVAAPSPYPDLWALSHARARTVMEYLIMSGPKKLDPARFRLVACADYEPVKQKVFSIADLRSNRRVEIVEREELVPDFTEVRGD